jgi:FixJ family two-component response regulator
MRSTKGWRGIACGWRTRRRPRYSERVLTRFDALSPREREVMALVVTGRLNKQIAADIGLSVITVKVHRSQVMRKMKASSVPDLARMADRLKLTGGKAYSC